MMVRQADDDRSRPNTPSGEEAEAERWLDEGGQDQRPERQEPPGAPAEDDRERSIKNIDENATEEASQSQSAKDAVDREAASPADQGGEA